MDNGLYGSVYNPDVLSCIANLSNDEVFTSPDVANKMLDLLPQELFENPDTTFLDPACKSGVFLREIAKRLIVGLEKQIPDLDKRVHHIFTKQLYGIAITELTSLLSRRSVYCSKYPNSEFSLVRFSNPEGNILYKRMQHTWKGNNCKYCGASKSQYDRSVSLESHAYQFIHTESVYDVFGKIIPRDMKFDLIIGNPPYQLSDGGGMQSDTASGAAIPLYHKFIQQAKKLQPKYLTMIIPARWYSGGRGLDQFREEMLNDDHILHLVDYVDSRDCFPGVDIAGGVCYFLWDRDQSGACTIKNVSGSSTVESVRCLNEYPVFIRSSVDLNIVHKVLAKKEEVFSSLVYSSKPFGIRSFEEGSKVKSDSSLSLLGSKGITYVERREIITNSELIDKWKVVMSKSGAEHAGQADKEGKKKVISRIEILPPGYICSETYLLVYVSDSQEVVQNVVSYMKSKLYRFLLSTVLLTQNIAKDKFCFIPIQDFSTTITDEYLNEKYGLTEEEVSHIDSIIKPFE